MATTTSNTLRSEFASALAQIASERNIEVATIITAIKDAILAAFRKDWQLTHETEEFDETAYEPFGINRAGVDILVHLRQNAPHFRVSPTQLCIALQSKSATMTSRLDKLEQAGFVRRLPDPVDRRALLVELTAAGRELVERVMASLSDREREVLRLRYGLGTEREHTLEEIGRRLMLTRERVRQIEAKAVAKMRAAHGRAA